ncbi:glycosyltransferase family 57 protein [Schizophyllum commune]
MPAETTAVEAPKAPRRWALPEFNASDWDILVLSTAFKLLLFPTYRSTDFEVHRNWLAITHSLPISQWYYDTTSEWTLDYPPFFAYFEKLLSIPASFIDPKIVDVNNLEYEAWSVIAYQRTTVILTELVLGAACLRLIRNSVDPATQRIIAASLFLHPGFIIVDHIHFQYNGFMFGILLWSIIMAREGKRLASGILFAVLLNFKHIYMYLAPAYFVYLLRSFCLSPTGRLQIKNFLSLANAVIAVFVSSLGPFMLMGQIPQLLSRLFPFKRGLNHAYWAPNVWALVTALDRVLLRCALALHAMICYCLVSAPLTSPSDVQRTGAEAFLVKLWFRPTYKSFLTALTLCGYTSFLFGWHVHEKAVLLVLVPLSLLAAERQAYFRTFLIASVAGIFSLFPLLFTPTESVIEVVYSIAWLALVYLPLSRRVYEFPKSIFYVILDTLEKMYLAGFIPLQLFVTLYPMWLSRRESSGGMEFLPLMLTSVYCAVGLVHAFVRLAYVYVNEERAYQGPLNEVQ